MTSPRDGNNVSRETIAAEVRAQLARHRRSGRSVALELGWNQNYMWRRLHGDIPFNVDDLASIAKVLGVSVASFFETMRLANEDQLRKQLLTLAVAA